MKYLSHYGDPTDTLYNLVPIALWSEMECTLGILAGSLATLRPLIRYLPQPLLSNRVRRPSSHPLGDWLPDNLNMNTPSMPISGHDSTARPMNTRTNFGRKIRTKAGEETTHMRQSFHIGDGKGRGEEGEEIDSVRNIAQAGHAVSLDTVEEIRYETRGENVAQEMGSEDDICRDP